MSTLHDCLILIDIHKKCVYLIDLLLLFFCLFIFIEFIVSSWNSNDTNTKILNNQKISLLIEIKAAHGELIMEFSAKYNDTNNDASINVNVKDHIETVFQMLKRTVYLQHKYLWVDR